MKKCISCAKDIPDTAFHCVFCGAKQGAPQTAGPAQRTIMGYAAADLQKLLPNQPGGPAGGAPQGGYVPTSGADQRTMMAGVGGAPLPQNPADQRTMMAGVGGAPLPQNPADQRTMMAGVGGAPLPQNPNDQRTMMAGVGGQPMQPQMMGGMPPMTPMQPMHPQMGQPQMGQPQMGGYPQQPMMQQPMMQQPMMQQPQGQRPQYLASQSAARDMAPTEPWAGSLRGMMIFFGIVLIATVALPMKISPMTFYWQVLTTGAPIQEKLWPLVLAAGGFLALLFGLLPVPTAARGIVAAIVGLLPFIVMVIAGSPGGGSSGLPVGGWQGYLVLAGIILAPTGLLIRSQYRSSALGRLLPLIGCGAIIAVSLIPVGGGGIPIIDQLKNLGGPIAALVPAIWALVLPAAAVLGLLLSLLPSSTSGGTGLFAWLIMSWYFGVILLVVVVAPILGGGSLDRFIKSPAGLALILDYLAWPVLAAYGLATTFGKSLEA